MGQTFELIADHALTKLDDYYTECHICERENLDLYVYHGTYTLEDGEKDDDIYALCQECILTKKVNHICDFEYIETIESYLSSLNLSPDDHSNIKQSLIAKYQKTPDIPLFMQYIDRPLCCEDITEFKGHPENATDLYTKTDNFVYWEKKVMQKPVNYDFKVTGLPESFSDIATFECRHCHKNYFTFQFS